METIARSGIYTFRWQPYVLLEPICLSGKLSFWSNIFLLVEVIIFLETIGLQQKSVHLVGTAPFNGRHFLYWKLFLLLEAINFSGNHSFQWNPFPVVEAIHFRERFCFLGDHCPWLKPFHLVEAISFQTKLLLLIETFPFSGSHSFFSILTFSSVEVISSYLNYQIYSVRL